MVTRTAMAANILLFQLGWFACVLGAARGRLWLGPVVAGALLLMHLASTPAREGRLILLAGLFGFAVDTSQASVGLFAFTGTSAAPWLCPPWMIALWMLFASTLNGSMSWLAGRYGIGAVLGAICGPASYLAGARLGDLAKVGPFLLAFGMGMPLVHGALGVWLGGLAGLGVGLWSSHRELDRGRRMERVFTPREGRAWREREYGRWRRAVRALLAS